MAKEKKKGKKKKDKKKARKKISWVLKTPLLITSMPERKKGNHDRRRNQKSVKRLIKKCRKDGKSSRLL
ncbi:hypothetical protein [Pedobacter kyonggii]|uniref:hypothetical protein n=1 Tax=Pedobacter kyonggii TaxID=1926871 RepID=UPI0013EF3989|nr:hypothetical protein [Pedobacter kyonggii]